MRRRPALTGWAGSTSWTSCRQQHDTGTAACSGQPTARQHPLMRGSEGVVCCRQLQERRQLRRRQLQLPPPAAVTKRVSPATPGARAMSAGEMDIGGLQQQASCWAAQCLKAEQQRQNCPIRPAQSPLRLTLCVPTTDRLWLAATPLVLVCCCMQGGGARHALRQLPPLAACPVRLTCCPHCQRVPC